VTFQDIFKKTFLENVQSLSLPEALLTLVSALLLGTFIFFITVSVSPVLFTARTSISP
jgi:hypothetical protein